MADAMKKTVNQGERDQGETCETMQPRETSPGAGEEIRDLKDTVRKLRDELETKESEIRRLKDENASLKQREEALGRMLESVSVGGLSQDSGLGSDTSSLASWTSRSSNSEVGHDPQGATGGEVKSKGIIKNLLKKLPGSRKRFAAKGVPVSIPIQSDCCVRGGNRNRRRTLSVHTLENLSTLTGNVDHRDVIVKTAPSSGVPVVMQELARTFEQSGPTLLVMDSNEHIQEARDKNTCSFMLTAEEWKEKRSSGEQLDGIMNIVTNCRNCSNLSGLKGSSWTFLSGLDDVKKEIPEETALKEPGIVMCVIPNEDNTTFLSLQCGQMEFKENRAMLMLCHVNEDGHLVNNGLVGTKKQEGQRFKRFKGAFSITAIHIKTPTSTPAPSSPHYFETEADLYMEGSLPSRFLNVLEIGVAEEHELGKSEMIYGMPRSWCVLLGSCSTQNHDICMQVYNQTEHDQCLPITMSENADSRYTLKIGVVVDVGIERICLIDLDSHTVLLKADAEFQDTLLPVFGVYSSPEDVTVKMRLISGAAIRITESKERLIYSCLT